MSCYRCESYGLCLATGSPYCSHGIHRLLVEIPPKQPRSMEEYYIMQRIYERDEKEAIDKYALKNRIEK